MTEIKIFSPGTVANVACGFDVLGFCLDSIGDEMQIYRSDQKGIRIRKVEGYDVPLDPVKNVAGVSALALLEDADLDYGFDMEIRKNIKPGSGIGSSSASASGSVFAINELLGRPYDKTQLTWFAMQGEMLASQSEHADNLAPGIFGGFTLVKSTTPLEVLELPVPEELYATVIHPQIEVKTSASRAVLPAKVPLKDAIRQYANVGSLVHALHTSDYELLERSLYDVLVEPHRSQFIPHYDQLREAAMDSGALGCGISGSGPSVFTLCRGAETAGSVADAFKAVFSDTDIDFEIYSSTINQQGIKIISS
jgi:homoserine kinase